MKSLKGHLLIADPKLITPFFTRTVILMLEHSASGAMGVVINRPTSATIGEVSEQLLEEHFDWDKAIYLGGPVSGPILAIHTDGMWAEGDIFPGVYSTIDAAKIRELIRRRTEPSLFVANYSGWGPGQLESEFDVDSWVTLPAKHEHLFRDVEELWDEVVKQAGTQKLYEFLRLREIPPDPRMN